MISFKKSIGLRLLRYVFGCYLVVTVVVTCIQLVSEYRHVKQSVFTELVNLASTFKSSFATSLWVMDKQQVDSTILGMQKIETLSGVKITNLENMIFASMGEIVTEDTKVMVSEHIEDGITVIKIDKNGQSDTWFEYKFPLAHKDELEEQSRSVGYGYIYSKSDTIISRVKYSFVLIIINSVIKTLALWLIFLFFARSVVAQPLGALTEAAQALNPNNPDTLSQPQALDKIRHAGHQDELFLLADSFTQMREAILNKIDFIEEQTQTLEQRVIERTQMLEQANSMLKQVNAELTHLTLHDPLTELPNRILFNDRLTHLLLSARRNNTEFALASIDLRKFKAINDNFGHQIGDKLLQEVARRMTRVLRDGDTLARMGGDEFAVLLPTVNAASAEHVAQKLLVELHEPILFGRKSILASANIGIVLFPHHGTDAETLFKHADMAMYQAKRADEGYCIFSSEYNSQISKQMRLSEELEHAVADNQFVLHYQPIVNLKTGAVVGVEALVRWDHPTYGMIPPLEFIALAERTGSIQILTHWVLETACTHCALWHEQGYELAVSVNLSGRLFSDPTLPDKLQQVLDACALETRWVNLEITESTAMAHPEDAIKILETINGLGFTVSIDDFGTGYSSFAYLTRLPVKELKIDRGFLLGMNAPSRMVVQSIIDLAHNLRLRVVAEGVENQEMYTLLTKMGCDYAQGYYLSKPLPMEMLTAWLQEAKRA